MSYKFYLFLLKLICTPILVCCQQQQGTCLNTIELEEKWKESMSTYLDTTKAGLRLIADDYDLIYGFSSIAENIELISRLKYKASARRCPIAPFIVFEGEHSDGICVMEFKYIFLRTDTNILQYYYEGCEVEANYSLQHKYVLSEWESIQGKLEAATLESRGFLKAKGNQQVIFKILVSFIGEGYKVQSYPLSMTQHELSKLQKVLEDGFR